MKRLYKFLLCILLIISFAVSVCAANAVPESVMKATESVVRVLAEYSDGYATGSGFVIKSDKEETLIATNYHVVEGKPYNISVWLNEEETVGASIVAYTNQKDMCILRLAYPVSVKPLVFSKEAAKQGDAVYAVGFPSAADILSDKEAHTSADATITDGIISAIREMTVSNYGTPATILQINAAINPGNSGGPLFDANGKVIGINTLGINDSQGIFGAIAVSELISFMADHAISVSNFSISIDWFIWVIVACIVIGIIVFFIARKKKMKAEKKTVESTISLRDYMKQFTNGICVNDAVAMLLPVALQLRDLHNNGRMHLEVSPDTIIVNTNGASLNIATSIEANRYTSGFAAPEIYAGNPSGNLSDIYSFCAVLSYVATGKQPLNALSRTTAVIEEEQEHQSEHEFFSILHKGMALDSTSRIESMQEVIIKLSRYNTRPFVFTSMDEDSSPETTDTIKSIKSKTRVFLILNLLLLAIIGIYIGCYIGAKTQARNGDFIAAEKLLFAPGITSLHDEKLVNYVDAGYLMCNREYSEALTAFKSLHDYENATEWTNETTYRLALQLADKNQFAKSALNLDTLAKIGYKDSALKLKDVQYRWAWALIDEGKYSEALSKLNAIRGYSDVQNTIDELTEFVYLEGQNLYHEGQYYDAERLFNCIASYEDTQKYLTLIGARGYEGIKNPELMAKKLTDIFYFEDASELLLSNADIACYFLLGNWKTSNGGYYFKIEAKNDGEYSFWSSYNIPWYGGSFDIVDGIYCVTSDNYKDKPQYKFTLLTPDSMELYCYKNGTTYTLYR